MGGLRVQGKSATTFVLVPVNCRVGPKVFRKGMVVVNPEMAERTIHSIYSRIDLVNGFFREGIFPGAGNCIRPMNMLRNMAGYDFLAQRRRIDNFPENQTPADQEALLSSPDGRS
jgi:hypothetical protein